MNTESGSTTLLGVSLAIVIPCYNAGPRLVHAATTALTYSRQVIVVDDGCTDDCMASLSALPVRMISFPANRGKGHALIAGIRAALEAEHLDAIALMDADGQHDASELPGLYVQFKALGADLLIGARQFNQARVPWRSRFGNRATAWVAKRLFGLHLPDTQCGYRLLSPRFAHAFVDAVPGGRYETEMCMLLFASQSGHRLASAPIATLYEPGNASSHFRKVRDSVRIYTALFRTALGPTLGHPVAVKPPGKAHPNTNQGAVDAAPSIHRQRGNDA